MPSRHEVTEIAIKNGDLLLNNRDGNVKVTVNQQIDDYPEVIKFIKQQCPDLWKMDEINSIQQEYFESVISFLLGLGALAAGIMMLFSDKLTGDMIFPALLTFGIFVAFVLTGSLRIRKLSLDGETLIVHYLFWKRQFHVKDVWSVSLESKFGKNLLLYEVHIRVKNKKDIVVENTRCLSFIEGGWRNARQISIERVVAEVRVQLLQ